MWVLQRIGVVRVARAARDILRTPVAMQSGASVCTLVSGSPVKPPLPARSEDPDDSDGRSDELRRIG
jgi:hypothetical protein